MPVYTNIKSTDGFGAQYQKVIQTFLFCKLNGLDFVYTPFNKMEHNYNNDGQFVQQKEDLINLYNNIPLANTSQDVIIMNYFTVVRRWFDNIHNNNIDIACNSEHMQFIKRCFWENKDRNVYKNNKKNVAIHIRRSNPHDFGQAGQRVTTSDEYYLNIMRIIRTMHNNTDILFHIFSQGNLDDFSVYKGDDVVFHINEDVEPTFIYMVAADILITSPSSFSYVAALISDGEIYFKEFWHKPRSHWIIRG
jgi:hypothetical protein